MRNTRRRLNPLRIGVLVSVYVPAWILAQASAGVLLLLRRGVVRTRRTAFLVAFATTIWWLLVLSAVVAGFTDGTHGFWMGLVLTLPVAGVAGWQIRQWAEGMFWSQQYGSVVLGQVAAAPVLLRRPYSVTSGERMKHLIVHGPTGSGKTTLLTSLIVQDVGAGAGLCVIDPKDNLIDRILPHIPAQRERDVIVLDATDTERPLGFNPLSGVSAERRSLATSEFIAVFRRYFQQSWGVRMEHILTNTILALLEAKPQPTLLDIPRMLLEPAFTTSVLAHVRNPGVLQFFFLEWELALRRRGDAVEPILNKVGPWLSFPEIRNVVGQPTSSFDPRQLMDEGKILLVRIPQGILGEEASSLIGALVVARMQLAAHSRADVHESHRRPFYLYVDEFQNFATSSFERILAEARAFKLGLVCANQYPEQLSRELQLAISRNAATTVHCVRFRGRYRLRVDRLEDVQHDIPSFAVTPPAPLPEGDYERAARIRALSRGRYGRDRASVEAELAPYLGTGSREASRVNGKTRPSPRTVRDLDEE